MLVSPGASVNVSIAGNADNSSGIFWGTSPAQKQSQIIQAINDSGWLIVTGQSWQTSSVGGIIGSLDLTAAPFTAALTVRVSAASDPVDTSDIADIVAQAVGGVTGYAPTVNADGGSAGGGPVTANPFQWVIDLVAKLESLGTFAVVAIVVLAAMLIFYVGPNVKANFA